MIESSDLRMTRIPLSYGGEQKRPWFYRTEITEFTAVAFGL